MKEKTETIVIKPIKILTDENGIIVSFNVNKTVKDKSIDEVYFIKIGSDSCFYIEGDNLKIYSSLPINGNI